jgi:CheY-like chemotaxis protein
MQGAGDRLFRLISDVLDFSIIEAGRLQIEREPVCLRDTIASIVRQHSKQAKAKGLAIVSNHNDFPDLSVLGDEQRIEQVLNNLVGNAVKFTINGQVSIESQLQIHGDSVHFRVEVSDTGPGIDPEKQKDIFQRFSSGDSSDRRRHGGAGLGLSIARGICQEMNAGLTLNSDPPHGSCFSFSLELELAHRVVTRLQSTVSSPLLHHHILLVDDTVLVRTVTAKILEALGCTVVTASSGAEAIRIIGNETFDLILMDWQMPDMDGIETAERLFRLHPLRKLRIAALTAHASLSDIERSKNSGMLGQLNKPFTINEIKSFIRQLDQDHPPHRN